MTLLTSLIAFLLMLVRLWRRESLSPLFCLGGEGGVTIQDQFFLSPVTSHAIWTFIGKMDASKSCGPYSIPVTILKTVRDYISEPLAFLVNDPLLEVIFLRN